MTYSIDTEIKAIENAKDYLHNYISNSFSSNNKSESLEHDLHIVLDSKLNEILSNLHCELKKHELKEIGLAKAHKVMRGKHIKYVRFVDGKEIKVSNYYDTLRVIFDKVISNHRNLDKLLCLRGKVVVDNRVILSDSIFYWGTGTKVFKIANDLYMYINYTGDKLFDILVHDILDAIDYNYYKVRLKYL